jgi:cell division protein FtsQ
VNTEGYIKTRSQPWEDETFAESRLRRVQQSVPPKGRVLPGMPLEMIDPDGEGPLLEGGARFGKNGFDRPRNPWWRPAGTVGRVFLWLGAFAVLGGMAASFILLKTCLGRDPRFRVSGTANLEARGLTEVSRAEMLPVFGEDVGRNIFFVPLAERRRQLEQIPWVEQATVMRLLPNRIRVEVVERQPVAFARQGQQFGLVDANGVLLGMPAVTMTARHYSFPVVTGIDAKDPAAVRKARMAVYTRLLAELDANHQKLSDQISEIDLSDPEDARVLMPEQGADILAHFGEDRFLERYQRYKTHIAEWRQQYPKLSAVDLRYDQQVVLEMEPGAGPAATAADRAMAANAGEGEKASDGKAGLNQAETRPASLVSATPGQSASEKPGAVKAAGGKAAQAKPAATAKPVKAAAKPGGKISAKPFLEKTRKAAREKAAMAKARQQKRAAEAKSAALNANRRKSAPPTHPVAVAAEGE